MQVTVQSSKSTVFVYMSDKNEDGVYGKMKHVATSYPLYRVRHLIKFNEDHTVKSTVEAKDFTVGQLNRKTGNIKLLSKYFPEYDGAVITLRSEVIGKVGDKVEEEKITRRGGGEAKEQAFKVGSILSTSWGYDQTNVDFFKVVSRTKRTVDIIEIGANSVEGSGGFMSDKVVPNPDYTTGEVMRKRIYILDGEEHSVKIYSFASATLFKEGSESYRSWYH